MPRFEKVGYKTESSGVLNEPFVRRSLYLDETIEIFGYNRLTADVNVDSASRRMSTEFCGERSASRPFLKGADWIMSVTPCVSAVDDDDKFA